MKTEINQREHFFNMINGMFMTEFIEETKKEIKQKKIREIYYKPIRQQFQFNVGNDANFIRNKQNFYSDIRTRIDKFSPDIAIEFIQSKQMDELYTKQAPDIIVDITGILAVKKNNLNSIYQNIAMTFYINSGFRGFINYDIREMLKGTDVPYNEELFDAERGNADKYFSSILAAYMEIHPEAFDELFKVHGYQTIIEYFHNALDVYQNKALYIKDEETFIKYIRAFLTNFFLYDDKTLKYTEKYMLQNE